MSNKRRVEVHNANLHVVPHRDDNGRTTYAERCGTCADVRPSLISQTTLVRSKNGLPHHQITEYRAGLVCASPENTRVVTDTEILLPATGEVVGRKDYCELYRCLRCPKQIKKH